MQRIVLFPESSVRVAIISPAIGGAAFPRFTKERKDPFWKGWLFCEADLYNGAINPSHSPNPFESVLITGFP